MWKYFSVERKRISYRIDPVFVITSTLLVVVLVVDIERNLFRDRTTMSIWESN